jgi:hypothetical protein
MAEEEEDLHLCACMCVCVCMRACVCMHVCECGQQIRKIRMIMCV